MKLWTAIFFILIPYCYVSNAGDSEFVNQIWAADDEQFFEIMNRYFDADPPRTDAELSDVWEESALPSFSDTVDGDALRGFLNLKEGASTYRDQLSKKASRALELRTAIVLKRPALLFDLVSERLASPTITEEDVVNSFVVVLALDDTSDRKPRGEYWLKLYQSSNPLYRILAVSMSQNALPKGVDLNESESNQFTYKVLKKREEWFSYFADDSEEEISRLAARLAERFRLALAQIRERDNTIKDQGVPKVDELRPEAEFDFAEQKIESKASSYQGTTDDFVSSPNKQSEKSKSRTILIIGMLSLFFLGITLLLILLRAAKRKGKDGESKSPSHREGK